MSGASNPQPLRSALKTDDDGDRTPPASGSLKGTFMCCFTNREIAGMTGEALKCVVLVSVMTEFLTANMNLHLSHLKLELSRSQGFNHVIQAAEKPILTYHSCPDSRTCTRVSPT